MPNDILLVDKKDNVCTITLNRPEKMNSLSPALLLKLADTMEALKKENGARAVVIRGGGDRAFSSGYDIDSIPTTPEDRERMNRENPLQTGLNSVSSYPFPVIAMINGICMGAGFELAVTCDLRIAAENVRFRMPPAKLGVLYSHTGIMRFINLVGVGYTKEAFFSGRDIDGQRAKEIGLLNYLVPLSELENTTYQLASEIAQNAPLSVASHKTVIEKCLAHQRLSDGDAEEVRRLTEMCFSSEDMKEAKKAFQEKRKPIFIGK